MKNFKEIAEKCLNGEISGIFTKRDGSKVCSNTLERDPYPSTFYKYQIGLFYYGINGRSYSFLQESPEDIIDFTPDSKYLRYLEYALLDGHSKIFTNYYTEFRLIGKEKNFYVFKDLEYKSIIYKTPYQASKLKYVIKLDMKPEQKKVQIEIPEGYEIDKENSTFEKIVFKKKDSKPKSWEEYCKNYKGTSFFINTSGTILPSRTDEGWNPELAKNLVPSKELAEAFLAMMQLISLRQAWIGDWDSKRLGYAIMLDVERNIFVSYDLYHRPLTFPERKLALEFRDCFKNLLEQAKPLL